MARVTYGALVTSINGKVGGSVFQNNKYGKTMKNSPNIVRPSSDLALSAQRALVQSTQAWQSLTDSQRALFNTYASTYPQYAKHNSESQLSGYAIFTRWCFYMYFQTATPSFNIPGVQVSLSPLTISPKVSSSVFQLDYVFSSTGTTLRWAIFISPVCPASRGYQPSVFRYATTIDDESDGSTLTDFWLENYGSLPSVGDQIYIRVVPYDFENPMVFTAQLAAYSLTELT